MKTKALYLTLVSISILAFLPISLFASNCGKELECPPGIKYPYSFCKFDTVTKKVTTETICTDDPLEYPKNNPNFVPQKVKLPICIWPPSTPSFFVSQFGIYRDGEFEVVLFGETYQRMFNTATRDVLAAANKWNCVCGDTISDLSTASIAKIGTIIMSHFSNIRTDFLEPYRTPAVAKILTGTQDDYPCGLNLDTSRILFNVTPEFLYQRNEFPNDGTPLEKGWFSQEYIGNVSLVPRNVNLYSFMQVALHEIGHLLGFGHYDVNRGTSIEQYCDNDGLILNGVMKYDVDDIRRENIIDLTLHDKCMMAKLYCPGLVILNIYEYQSQTQRVYPNPGKYVVNFEFELPRHTENLTMTVKDVLGQTVLTVLNNTVKEAGKHTMLINVDGLAVGTYYIIIEAGSYRTAQPVMIVR